MGVCGAAREFSLESSLLCFLLLFPVTTKQWRGLSMSSDDGLALCLLEGHQSALTFLYLLQKEREVSTQSSSQCSVVLVRLPRWQEEDKAEGFSLPPCSSPVNRTKEEEEDEQTRRFPRGFAAASPTEAVKSGERNHTRLHALTSVPTSSSSTVGHSASSL